MMFPVKISKENGSLIDLLVNDPWLQEVAPRKRRIVFMHDSMSQPGGDDPRLFEKVKGIELYDRALSLARRGDVVFLQEPPVEGFQEYLLDAGFGTEHIIVVQGKGLLPEKICNNGTFEKLNTLLGSHRAVVSVYQGEHVDFNAVHHIDPGNNLNVYATPPSQNANKYSSKIEFKALCERLGVPVVPRGEILQVTEDHAQDLDALVHKVKNIAQETGGVIIRGEYGSSGSTTVDDLRNISLFSEEAIPSILQKRVLFPSSLDDRYLIEPFYTMDSSPSSTWFVTKHQELKNGVDALETKGGETVHLRTSDQIMSGVVHEGNEFPGFLSPAQEHEIKQYTYAIVSHLALQGYIGPIGVDWIKVNNQFYASEANPRITGAMYGWENIRRREIRHKKQVEAGRLENLAVPAGISFPSIVQATGNYLYHPSQGSPYGIVIFNGTPSKQGKITVVGAAPHTESLTRMFDGFKEKVQALYK
jgi:hypothetical protein